MHLNLPNGDYCVLSTMISGLLQIVVSEVDLPVTLQLYFTSSDAVTIVRIELSYNY